MIAEITIFGLTLAELAVAAAAIGYVVSLVRDWRPMKALRQENRDLRAQLEQTERNFEKYKIDTQVKIVELTNDLHRLKRATDLSPIATQQQKSIEVLTELVAEVKSLDGSVRANTAAVETLSKRRIIDEALKEAGGDT